MSIDFGALVLAPNFDVFGVDLEVTLSKSRPGDPPYYGVGIFSSKPVNIAMQDGSVFSDQETTIDLKIDQWDYLPERSDRVKVIDSDVAYWVADASVDGQGAVRLTVHLTEPGE